jgi:4,5-dihydroxyphthalate decarboxylase
MRSRDAAGDLVMPTFPAKGPVSLRTNLADSPTAAALKSGAVSSPLVNFDFAGPKVANEGFKPMVREGKFQAGELAIVTYLQARAYGKPLMLLPATMFGRFQHHMLATSTLRGAVKPKDLEGQKVALRAYSQTTGVWVRGLLQHEYGVDLGKVTWLCRDDSHVAEAPDPANVERIPDGAKSLENLVLDGDVIAGILGNELPKDPRVRHFFQDYPALARAWHAKYHTVHINHLFVVHADLTKERPDVVKEIYRVLAESKAAANLKGDVDLLPFGLSNMRRALELVIGYAFEQKLLPRLLSVDELFDDTTRALGS